MKKNGIVVHIGLPKTATTYIQRMLSNKKNYVGLESSNSSYTERLLEIFNQYSRGKNVVRQMKVWIQELTEFAERDELENPIILSSEFFFAGEFNGVPEFPMISRVKSENGPLIAEFLKDLSDISHSSGLGPTKVLLTIRNQPDWLASKYAQASTKIFSPSQRDLEARIENFCQLENLSWCDWSLWIKKFDKLLGPDNVNVLCMEEMDSDEFWRALSTLFTGCEEELLRERTKQGQQLVNKKRNDVDEWRLGEFQFGAHLAKKMGLVPGTHAHRFCLRAGNFVGRIGDVCRRGRSRKIKLSETVRSRCGQACGVGNAWLEKRLKRDLAALGYPIQSKEDLRSR